METTSWLFTPGWTTSEAGGLEVDYYGRVCEHSFRHFCTISCGIMHCVRSRRKLSYTRGIQVAHYNIICILPKWWLFNLFDKSSASLELDYSSLLDFILQIILSIYTAGLAFSPSIKSRPKSLILKRFFPHCPAAIFIVVITKVWIMYPRFCWKKTCTIKETVQ